MTDISRRHFLKVMGASGVAFSQAVALQDALASAVSQGGFLPANATERDPVLHAINRLTFGPSDALMHEVQAMGVDAFIEAQLNPTTINDDEFDEAYGDLFPYLQETSADLLAEYLIAQSNDPQAAGRTGQVLVAQLLGNWFYRSLASKRQLNEVMSQFWSNHFSIYTDSLIDNYLRVDDENNVARANPFGKFYDILYASATSPAMLLYLDNATSQKEAPNENYARELLELHTLGVNGGYTEDDVKDVARAFTGWSVSRPRQGVRGQPGTFRFEPTMHDTGEKVILGNVIPAGGGMEDGERVLEILARHPSTARFITEKLIRRFVSDVPPQALWDSATETFLQTDGDIRSVLRTIFSSAEFWDAPPKFKQPLEYIISTLRSMNYEPTRFQAVVRSLRTVLLGMGHLPFNRPSPDGYPDVQSYWMTNLLTRWNIAISVAHGEVAGMRGSLSQTLEANNIPLEPQPVLNYVGILLYGRELTTFEMGVLDDYLAATGETVESLQDTIALLLAAPAFQYR